VIYDGSHPLQSEDLREISMENSKKAELVLKNAKVWTVDPGHPRAEAVAIEGNYIKAVGATAEMEPLAGPNTQVVDLGGRLVLPGFNDCHTHFVSWAIRSSGGFDVYGAETLEEVQQRLQQYDQSHPEDDWLFGMRWQPAGAKGDWPNAKDLDAVVKDRPVAIIDIDGHTGWVNTKGLERLGFDAFTADPEGGTILRDPSGKPTGVLFENAHENIPRPKPSNDEDFKASITEEIGNLHRLGITSLSDNYLPLETMQLCGHIAQEGDLDLRINYWPLLVEEFESLLSIRDQFKDNPRIQVVGVKAFIDGVLSNRTAWMLDSYPGYPEESGYPVNDLDELTQKAIQADKDGFQIVIHAIGNRGVREVLDIYEKTQTENGARDHRHRIEHVEVTHPEDQERFADLGVIASMTPVHYCERINYQDGSTVREDHYPNMMSVWRTFVDSGVHLCFGTDWPALDLARPDPLKQIFSAVARVPPQMPEVEPKGPEQALTIEQAINCYTLESAYAEFAENTKGSITAGKVADLCVLDKNILEVDPGEILQTKVVMTVFDGEVVFREL
jgi:predicted amidohydrolase YtcJ